MYRTVVCFNTGNSYTVTDNENIYNGCVAPGVRFYTRDEDAYYIPVKTKTEYVIRKASTKPSIYKRSRFQCYKDRYDYAFTERTTKTVTTDKDVYYNAQRDRFISRSSIYTKTKTEYSLPHLIVW